MMFKNMALEYINSRAPAVESFGKAHPEVIENLGFLFSSTPHGNVATL
jgi:hypothetical protein